MFLETKPKLWTSKENRPVP